MNFCVCLNLDFIPSTRQETELDLWIKGFILYKVCPLNCRYEIPPSEKWSKEKSISCTTSAETKDVTIRHRKSWANKRLVWNCSDHTIIIFSFFLHTKGNHWRHSVKLLYLEKKKKNLAYEVPFLRGMFIELLPSSCKCPHISHSSYHVKLFSTPKKTQGESLNQNERRRIWRIESLWIVKTEHGTEWNKRGSLQSDRCWREKSTSGRDYLAAIPTFSVELH